MSSPGAGLDREDRGFALVVVVFLLFAIGVSAAATYQVIRTEVELASAGSDSDRARAAAEAGARMVIGKAIRGVPNDTVFTIDDGSAFPPEVQVTIRRQVDDSDWDDLYLIRAIGRVTDPRNFDYPAIREVRVFGRLRTPPMDTDPEPRAVLVATEAITNNAANGNDAAGGACTSSGNISERDQYTSLFGIGLPDFSYFTSASYPVDYAWSSGAWNPPGSPAYPVVRVTGNFTGNNSRSGQGVLIVGGNLAIQNNFTWNGIILVGGTVTAGPGNTSGSVVYGQIVAGLAGGAGTISLTGSIGLYQWHSCHYVAAGQAIGAMNIEPLTWWSGY